MVSQTKKKNLVRCLTVFLFMFILISLFIYSLKTLSKIRKVNMKKYQEKIEEFQSYFKSRSKSKEYIAHSSKVHSVGWSCDGRRLASGSFDKSVCVQTLDRDRLVSFLSP